MWTGQPSRGLVLNGLSCPISSLGVFSVALNKLVDNQQNLQMHILQGFEANASSSGDMQRDMRNFGCDNESSEAKA